VVLAAAAASLVSLEVAFWARVFAALLLQAVAAAEVAYLVPRPKLARVHCLVAFRRALGLVQRLVRLQQPTHLATHFHLQASAPERANLQT